MVAPAPCPIRDWTARFNFGGPRDPKDIIGVCIHTTENSVGTPAENVAQYQIDTASGSYHVLADRKGLLVENTDDWVTWSTGNKGNYVLLHLSFVCFASFTRDQWLAEKEMLKFGACQVAQWCERYNIPVRFARVSDLPGITTHDATRAWGGTDHTDPGKNFPWDVFLGYVNEFLNPQEDDMFTDNDRALLQRVHHELTHRFESRYDLAAGKEHPFRDTMIGYVLEADRKQEAGKVSELSARLDDLSAKLDHIASSVTKGA